MQVLVVVLTDDGGSQTFKLKKFKETRNYVVFRAGDMGEPLISRAYVKRGFKAANKSERT